MDFMFLDTTEEKDQAQDSEENLVC